MEVAATGALVDGMQAVKPGRPRVLFVGAFPPPQRAVFGGMVTSCRALLGSSFPERVELDLLDSTQISNPPPRLPVRLALAAIRCLRFIARFESRRPQAVLLFVGVGASIVEKSAMAWYARVRGVPTLMFPRGEAPASRWAIWSLRGASKMLCQSQAWQRFAIDKLGLAPADAPVIRNWTATRELLEIGARRAPSGSAHVRLLFIGWLEREKGVFELIDACRRLADTRRFKLDMIGDGRARGQLAEIIGREGLTQTVRLHGWLSAEQVPQALRDADVLVLPSWAEGLPNAMVEAMAARLAVVVSRVGAVPDVIEDRRSGLLVAPRDGESLLRALTEIIDDAGLRERLANRAFEIAAQEFGVEAAAGRLVFEIEEASARSRAARRKIVETDSAQ